MIIQCPECGEAFGTVNPAAWLEHLSDGGHVFHPHPALINS